MFVALEEQARENIYREISTLPSCSILPADRNPLRPAPTPYKPLMPKSLQDLTYLDIL